MAPPFTDVAVVGKGLSVLVAGGLADLLSSVDVELLSLRALCAESAVGVLSPEFGGLCDCGGVAEDIPTSIGVEMCENGVIMVGGISEPGETSTSASGQ